MTLLWRQTLRNAQTYLPAGLHERRLDGQQWVNRLLRHPHEREFKALRGRLPPKAHVLDLGANRGQSIEALLMLGVPALRITAFEPQSALAARLRRRYPPTVTVHNVGVGDKDATTTLFTPSYRGYRFDGLASTDRAAAVDWFPYSVKPFRPELLTVDEECVSITTIDSYDLDRVDFIKFDVQGMELQAMQGAEALLGRDKPLLMVEVPDEATVEWLGDMGYVRFDALGNDLVAPIKDRWSVNTFFEHPARRYFRVC